MKKKPAVRIILLVGGLLLGLIVYGLSLAGVAVTAAALLHARATVEPPAQAVETVEGVSLEEEISTLLAGSSLGGSATISEASLNRLVAIGVTEGEMPAQLTLHALEVELRPSAILVSAAATVHPAFRIGNVRLAPQTTQIALSLRVQPGSDGLVLFADGARIGRVDLPDLAMAALSQRIDPNSLGLPFVRTDSGFFFLSYDELNSIVPPALVLEGVLIREGHLVVQIRVSEEIQRQLVSDAVPLVREYGEAAREAVARALGSESLVTRSVNDLFSAATALPELPSEPTALVSYRERDVEATPPDAEAFSPAVGTDLTSGTLLRTGEESYVECILRDQTLLRVDQNSEVYLEELPPSPQAARGRFALLSGRIRAQVASIAGTDYRFTAGDSVCGVRGTDLVIDLSADRNLILSVLEGSVVLAPPGGTEVSVAENQMVSVQDNALAVALTPGARDRIESELHLRTSHEDAATVREVAWLWSLLEETRILAMQILALDSASRERLAAELQARIDTESIRPRLERILQEPEVLSTLEGFGVADPLDWLDKGD